MKPGLARTLEAGDVMIGSFHDFAVPEIVELVGYAGFDFVVLEYEHGLTDLTSLQHVIRAAEGAGIYTFVRVGDSDTNLIGKLLDGGADGIIVAHVKSAADAIRAVRAAKYPPSGSRGEGYARRGELWDLSARNRDGQLRRNEDIGVIAIIEDPEGVDNIGDILQVEGLTGVMPGAGDLSLSLGLPIESNEVQARINAVQDAVSRSGKQLMNFIRVPEAAPPLIEAGCTMLLHGHDAMLIGDLYHRLANETRNLIGS